MFSLPIGAAKFFGVRYWRPRANEAPGRMRGLRPIDGGQAGTLKVRMKLSKTRAHVSWMSPMDEAISLFMSAIAEGREIALPR